MTGWMCTGECLPRAWTGAQRDVECSCLGPGVWLQQQQGQIAHQGTEQ